MSDAGAVSTVIPPAEIARVLKTAEATHAEAYCELVAAGGAPVFVELEIRKVIGTSVVFGIRRIPGQPMPMLSKAFPSSFKIGDAIEIIFSIVDGQYSIRDVVQDISMTTFTVSASRNFLRLQRRKDFRVPVRSDGLTFSMRVDGQERSLALVDLSAGGLRLLWTPDLGPLPTTSVNLLGRLQLQPKVVAAGGAGGASTGEATAQAVGKTVDVEMKLVRDHGLETEGKPELGNEMSFQFVNLGQEDARAILFTCLFLHRAKYGGGI